MGWLDKIKQGLARTASPLVSGISDLLTKRKLDKDALTDLEDLLIMADVGTKTAAELVDGLSKDKFDKEVDSAEVRAFSPIKSRKSSPRLPNLCKSTKPKSRS